MYKNKRIIVLVPARGGSKGIPYKNIKLLMNKPLIGWTLELAGEIPEVDKIVVSTDDLNISIISQYYGAEVIKRPAELSADHSLSIDAVKHTLQVLNDKEETYDIMLYLEPTSPLRTKEDIYDCLDLLIDNDQGYTSTATFSEAELNPIRAWTLEGTKPKTFIENVNPFMPRQKLPKAYKLNGSVYAFFTDTIADKVESFLDDRTGGVITSKDRAIDIDEEIDFILAEKLIERSKKHGE